MGEQDMYSDLELIEEIIFGPKCVDSSLENQEELSSKTDTECSNEYYNLDQGTDNMVVPMQSESVLTAEISQLQEELLEREAEMSENAKQSEYLQPQINEGMYPDFIPNDSDPQVVTDTEEPIYLIYSLPEDTNAPQETSNKELDKIKKFACDFCKNVFREKGNSVVYIKTNSKNLKRYVCPPCQVEYKCQPDIQMRNHVGEKLYFCQYCSYKITHAGQMRVHTRTHTGEKPFACNFCKFKCSNVSNLNTHMTTHSCPHCSYRTATRLHLTKHIERHAKLYPCKYCKNKYSTEIVLNRHMKTHTKYF